MDLWIAVVYPGDLQLEMLPISRTLGQLKETASGWVSWRFGWPEVVPEAQQREPLPLIRIHVIIGPLAMGLIILHRITNVPLTWWKWDQYCRFPMYLSSWSSWCPRVPYHEGLAPSESTLWGYHNDLVHTMMTLWRYISITGVPWWLGTLREVYQNCLAWHCKLSWSSQFSVVYHCHPYHMKKHDWFYNVLFLLHMTFISYAFKLVFLH
jgi:hypothetical protein